jgi:hypothetical protein
VGAAGGIDVVVSAMRRHVASPDVQKRGCAALCSLADRSVGNNAAIGAAGGVDVAMMAMTRHADSAAVQRHGCDALRVSGTGIHSCSCVVTLSSPQRYWQGCFTSPAIELGLCVCSGICIDVSGKPG